VSGGHCPGRLSRWGVSCAFAGVLGDDQFGSMIKSSLADEGIDTDPHFRSVITGQSRKSILWNLSDFPPKIS